MCKESKASDDFNIDNRSPSGLQARCRSCEKAHGKKRGDIYLKSEIGVITTIYKTQRRNQLNRGFSDVPYSKSELSDWMYKNGFKSLYDNWILNGCKKLDKPSPDRIDSLKGYYFDNLQLVTWRENLKNQAKDTYLGLGSSGLAKCKPVLKLDKHMNVKTRFVSMASASRDYGSNVQSKIKSKQPSAEGFYYVFECEHKLPHAEINY